MSLQTQLHILPLLAVYAKVVEHGSFKAAADELGRSASSVTRDIATLEATLNISLLQRAARQKVIVTDAGNAIYKQACNLLSSSQAALSLAAHSSDELSGSVHIAGGTALMSWIVQPCIADFLASYPRIQILLRTVQSRAPLVQGTPDILVLPHGRQLPNVPTYPLLDVNYVLCASPHYLASNKKPLNHPTDLTMHDCLHVSEDPSDSDWRFSQGPNVVNVTARSRYTVSNSSLLLQAMLDHLGVACLPDFTVRRALSVGIATRILPDWVLSTSYSGNASLSTPAAFVTPQTSKLVEHIQHAIAQSTHPLAKAHHPVY